MTNRVTLDPANARPVQAVWPQAMRTLPARLPNGSDYNPLEEVADGVFVVQAKAGFERYGSVYRFSPATGELRMLIDARQLNPSTTRIAPVGKAWVINGGTYVAVRSAYQEIDQDPERGPDEDGRLEHEPACWSRRPPDSGKTVINLSAIN